MIQPRCIALLITTTMALLTKGVQGQHLPGTIDVKPGETVRLNCSTSSLSSADWHYRKKKQADSISVYIGNSRGGGRISNSYKSRTRYSVYEDIVNGIYDLIIKNVTKSDEGIYICSETSDPDIFTSTNLTILDEKIEECPYDEAALTGEFVQLRFHTTQSDSIHVEHRSIDRSYPLHVFRDGKIVNDYYSLSGRFGFNHSDETWNLLVRNIQLSDAGTYICSEDNGLGRQYTKELVVIGKTVRFEIEGETCMNGEVYKVNVTCAANYSGHRPPCLQVRLPVDGQKGKTKVLPSNESVTSQTTVQLRTVVSGDDLKFKLQMVCAVATPNAYAVLAYGNETRFTPSYAETCIENNNNDNKFIILAVVLCLLLFIAIPIIGVIIFKRVKYKKLQMSSKNRATNQNLLPAGQEMQPQASPQQTEETLT